MQFALLLLSLLLLSPLSFISSQLLTDCTLNELLKSPPVLIEYFGCNEASHKMTKIFYLFSQKLVESKDFFNFVKLSTGRIDCDRTPQLCCPLPRDPCEGGGCGKPHSRHPHRHGKSRTMIESRKDQLHYQGGEWRDKLPRLQLVVNSNYKVFKGFLTFEELVRWVARWLSYTPCWINFMLTAVGIPTTTRCQ